MSVCFCLDKYGQAIVERMDLFIEDVLINFVNALFRLCQNVSSVESIGVQLALTPNKAVKQL